MDFLQAFQLIDNVVASVPMPRQQHFEAQVALQAIEAERARLETELQKAQALLAELENPVSR